MRIPIRATTLTALAASTGCLVGPLRRYDPAAAAAGGVVLHVPLVRQQERYDCGFAAATMLALYYKRPFGDADAERLRLAAASDEKVSGRLLAEVLEANGFHARVFAGDLLDTDTPAGIAYHLDRGRPLVVMVSPKGDLCHFMVVSGLNVSKDLVYFEDPDKGKVACRGRAFRKMWERAGSFTLLAVPVVPEHAGAFRK